METKNLKEIEKSIIDSFRRFADDLRDYQNCVNKVASLLLKRSDEMPILFEGLWRKYEEKK